MAGEGASSPGAFFAIDGERVPFADLLCALGGGVAPPQPGREGAPVGSAGAGQPKAEKKGAKGERDKDEGSKGDEAAAAPDAGIAAGIPLTINTLNTLLLRGDGAKQEAPPHDPGAAEPRGGAGRSSERKGTDPAPAVDESAGQSKAPSAPATAPGPKEAAPSPLGALTKAGETAQTTVQASKPGSPEHPASSSGGATPDPKVEATGALTKLAVAAPAQAAAIRDVKPGASGPGVAGITGGAQATRGGARALRPTGAPAPPDNSEARRAAFQAQLARGVAAALEKGGGTLTLRVKPEALGQVQVKVTMKDGVVSAHFEAQTSEARDLLLASTGDLRRSLEAAGVSVERVEASVSPHLNDPTPVDPSFGGLQEDSGGAGAGSGAPDRNDSGPQSRRRGTDAALLDGTDDAAEPRAQNAGWLVLGLDTIA
jgi:flagellar hook-length control protein FliK